MPDSNSYPAPSSQTTPVSTSASAPEPAVDLSVIICTYNRSGNLPLVLKCLAEQTDVENLQWEVLVVDNNSSDDTRQVVETLSKTLPIRLRYTFETTQGLNYARNHGIDESKGRYVLYIDDDILVTRQWLHAMYQTLTNNDADSVGGRIHLQDDIKLPGWIKPDMYGFLGYQDYGDSPFPMDGVKQYPFGGNMAFNRRVIDKIGKFNPKLGRKGEGKKRKELFKGAEADFLHRLSSTDAKINYTPDGLVYHMIKPHQLTKRYFRILHFNHGVQEAFYSSDSYPRRLFGVPLFLFGQAGRHSMKYLGILLTQGSETAFRQQMNVAYFIGRIIGFSRASRVQE